MAHYEISVEVGALRKKFCVDADAAPEAGDRLVYVDGDAEVTLELQFAPTITTRDDGACTSWGTVARVRKT